MQVYRSVLLNNGRQVRPQPDTSSGQQDTPVSVPLPATSFSGNTAPTRNTPVEELLYRVDIPVGSRGDVIEFYNKVFIGLVKDFVLKFSPCDDVSCACVQC